MKFWKAVDGAQARLAADQAEDLRTAIKRSVDVDQVVEDWLRSHANTPSIKPSEARHWAKLNVRVDNTVTRAVWRRMLATGYVLGDDVAPVAIARSQLNKADAPDLSSIQTAINYDWSNWKAGNRAASALLQPPKGLAQLLAQTNASIAGMDATTLDRLGTVLADSLNTGASVSATAQSIVREGLASSLKVGLEAVLQDAQRAMTISRTEISRALNVSCRENYQELGVEKYEWLALEPCDDCEENDGVVVAIGDEFPSGDTEPPVHPNCRCTILPVIDEDVPAIEDQPVDEEPVEDVVPEMQDASDLLAVDTHPDLTVETTGLQTAVAEGRTISTPYEATNELWKPLVETRTDATFTSTHTETDAANAKLKETVNANLIAKFNETGADVSDLLKATHAFDENQIERMTVPSTYTSGLERFNVVQDIRGSVFDLPSYGRLETPMLEANPELVKLQDAGVAWQNQVTETQFQKGLDRFNEHYAPKGVTFFRSGTTEANQAIIKGTSNKFVETWANTSNNENVLSLSIQQTAAEHFGLTATADWTMPDYLSKQVADAVQNYGDVYKAILDSQYEATQAFFKEQGISEITLYRGVRDYVADGLVTATEKGVSVTTRPLSSFTTNKQIATQFAGRMNKDRSAIFQTTVPVEKVLSIPGTGFGCYTEYEVVVLGGTNEMNVANVQEFVDWGKTLQDTAQLWEQNV